MLQPEVWAEVWAGYLKTLSIVSRDGKDGLGAALGPGARLLFRAFLLMAGSLSGPEGPVPELPPYPLLMPSPPWPFCPGLQLLLRVGGICLSLSLVSMFTSLIPRSVSAGTEATGCHLTGQRRGGGERSGGPIARLDCVRRADQAL